jgi:outer membrane protein TolC
LKKICKVCHRNDCDSEKYPEEVSHGRGKKKISVTDTPVKFFFVENLVIFSIIRLMHIKIFPILALSLLIPQFIFSEEAESTESTESLSLEQALNLAIQNNYEIKKQRYALAAAQAQYRQAKGLLDVEVGAEAGYSLKQNPVDENDPSYGIDSIPTDAGTLSAYSDNTLTQQTSGSVFIQKLFGFGLQSKLSYTVNREKNTPEYTYSAGFPESAKIKEQEARNYGTVALELSLPLFKSFNDSIASLQLKSAKAYIDQMNAQLEDSISKTVIAISQKYYNYFLSYNYFELITSLQNKIEERNKNMDSLIRAGVRSKNDMLAMRVNEKENQRNVENARVSFHSARMELMTALGITDPALVPPPSKNSFPKINIEEAKFLEESEIDQKFLENVIQNRNDILSLRKGLEAAEKKLRIARVDSRPDANLGFGIGATGTEYTDSYGKLAGAGTKNIRGIDISGKVSVSAKLGNNSKKGAEEQALAEYNSLLADYENALNTLAIQVKNVAGKISVYKNSVQNADEVLDLQKNLYENEQKRFNAGLITVDNLLSQDEKYISAENSYYQVLINYLLSVLEYKYYTAELIFVEKY